MSRLSQEVTRIITLLLLVQYFGHVTAHRHFAFTKRQNSAVGCLRVKGVPAVDPWDERYTNYSSPYNLRLQYKPEVIALAETNEHVSAAVRCACRSGLKVQARSGGHSYASYGMGGVDGALIVDTQRFQDVSYDENSKVATFGAGVRLGNLALALQEYGRAVPHGTCSNVGVGGHFTHGGNGFTSRAHGMAIDSLVAMDVVLADGTLVHATATEHSDVFFAMRGVGSSFGIATTFYANTFPIPTVTGVYLAWPEFMSAAPEDGVAALKHIQDFATNASSGMNRNFQFDFLVDAFGTFALKGAYLGPVSEFNTSVLPELIRGLPTPAAGDDTSSTFIKEYSWEEALVDANYGGQLEYPKPRDPHYLPTPDHDNFYLKSLNVPPPGLSDEAMKNLITWAQDHQLDRNPVVPWYFSLLLQGGYDNQIYLESRKDDAAFWRRDLVWIIESSGFVEPADALYPEPEGIDFINEINAQVIPTLPPGPLGAFQICVDPELTAEEAGLLYYGEELFEKLKALKQRLDPHNVFHNPQSIPIST